MFRHTYSIAILHHVMVFSRSSTVYIGQFRGFVRFTGVLVGSFGKQNVLVQFGPTDRKEEFESCVCFVEENKVDKSMCTQNTFLKNKKILNEFHRLVCVFIRCM